MKKAKLFQYAILLHPTEQQEKDGKKSSVLVEPKTILATDDKAAFLSAARDIPADAALDQVEVIIRPF